MSVATPVTQDTIADVQHRDFPARVGNFGALYDNYMKFSANFKRNRKISFPKTHFLLIFFKSKPISPKNKTGTPPFGNAPACQIASADAAQISFRGSPDAS